MKITKMKSRSGHFSTVTLSFLCFDNSKSSPGPAFQNAGHWSRMPHLCGGSPQPPVHPRVVRSRRGWRGEATIPAVERSPISIEALILLISDFLLFYVKPPPQISDKQLEEREHTIEQWKGRMCCPLQNASGCAHNLCLLLFKSA